MAVVAVRLVRDALRRAEVDAAGHRPAGLVVEHGDVDPVAAGIDQLQAHAVGRRPLALDVAPGDLAEIASRCFTVTVADGIAAIWV